MLSILQTSRLPTPIARRRLMDRDSSMGVFGINTDQTRPSGSRLRRINSASTLLKTNNWGADVRPLFGRLHGFHLGFGFQRREDEGHFRFVFGTRHAIIPDTVDENDGQFFLKQPSLFQSRQIPSSASNTGLAKSIGPNRQIPTDRPQTSSRQNGQNGRLGHARSKSQAPRPKTAAGHRDRDDDRFDTSQSGNGTANSSSDSLRYSKVRARRSNSASSSRRDRRELSLASQFNQLSLEDKGTVLGGTQAISQLQSRQFFYDSVTTPHQTTTSFKCPAKDKPPGKLAAAASHTISQGT
ncbi:hypothetical protein BGZ63DRAFT_42699 [Mariannaea sp. PMI_226]|nr:hypothetical protein BGZ63DRAFT_42699 [Mariannaea sp. PMI_226]